MNNLDDASQSMLVTLRERCVRYDRLVKVLDQVHFFEFSDEPYRKGYVADLGVKVTKNYLGQAQGEAESVCYEVKRDLANFYEGETAYWIGEVREDFLTTEDFSFPEPRDLYHAFFLLDFEIDVDTDTLYTAAGEELNGTVALRMIAEAEVALEECKVRLEAGEWQIGMRVRAWMQAISSLKVVFNERLAARYYAAEAGTHSALLTGAL